MNATAVAEPPLSGGSATLAQEEKTKEKLGPSASDEESNEVNSIASSLSQWSKDSIPFSGDQPNASNDTGEPPIIPGYDKTGSLIRIKNDAASSSSSSSSSSSVGIVAASQVNDTNKNSINSNASGQVAKERLSGGCEIGATQVDEQAPQLNRRFFLGFNRVSARRRAREARARRRRQTARTTEEGNTGEQRGQGTIEEGAGEAQKPQNERGLEGTRRISNAGDAEARGGRTWRRASTIQNAIVSIVPFRRLNTRGEYLTNAVLVEEVVEAEAVVAEPLGYFAQKWKTIVCGTCFMFLTMTVVLSVYLVAEKNKEAEDDMTDLPSMQPSPSPSMDPRPTLDILQSRDFIRCGRGEWSKTESEDDLYIKLCRSIAAVVLGDPDKVEEVIVTGSDRFEKLHGGDVDLLLYGDTYTIEREVREKTTGSGFTFSTPYFYDGLTYYGESKFVECAEERKRYDYCSSLRICTYEGSTGLSFLCSYFPSDFIVVGSSLVEMMDMMRSGACNVMAGNKESLLLNIASIDIPSGGDFVMGDRLMTNEPYAVVTRNDDSEFSDIINWVVQALFYGEEKGLTKSSSLCEMYTNSTRSLSDLNFLNAVYCVGNYGEILHGDDNNRGANQINNGTTGMLYAIPFGELQPENDHNYEGISSNSTVLHNMRNNGTLNCGVIDPGGHDSAEVDETLVGMSVDYCRTLAAALFNGNFESINLLRFSANDDDSFLALNNGTIDVISGVKIEKKYDFESSALNGGFHFSTPYYYGNKTEGDNGIYSLATRDANVLLSSFVNCIVLATIYAQKNNIAKKNSVDLPLVSLFGNEFTWALRDAIGYSGSYGQIYEKNFDKGSEEEGRGRNDLNEYGGPQILSFPGLN